MSRTREKVPHACKDCWEGSRQVPAVWPHKGRQAGSLAEVDQGPKGLCSCGLDRPQGPPACPWLCSTTGTAMSPEKRPLRPGQGETRHPPSNVHLLSARPSSVLAFLPADGPRRPWGPTILCSSLPSRESGEGPDGQSLLALGSPEAHPGLGSLWIPGGGLGKAPPWDLGSVHLE